jgi:hypothetical protein
VSIIDDGGFAFPLAASTGDSRDGVYCQNGMTLRDWFAGQALIALPHIGCGADLTVKDTAEAAYQIADAMIKARGSVS